jgi:16S rRNA U516 pseudouridylate synthase RsuA-like enzyme
MSIDPEKDKIELLNKIIEDQDKLVYYKLNKPRGIVTTCAQN